MVSSLLVGLVACTSLARRAWAQGAVEKRFDQLDRNGDGKITADELPAAEFFKRLDLDGHGEITKPEAAKALARGAMNNPIKPKPATPAPTGPTPWRNRSRRHPARAVDLNAAHILHEAASRCDKSARVGAWQNRSSS